MNAEEYAMIVSTAMLFSDMENKIADEGEFLLDKLLATPDATEAQKEALFEVATADLARFREVAAAWETIAAHYTIVGMQALDNGM